jgi:tetratricopeptide (TPR) repeat protein
MENYPLFMKTCVALVVSGAILILSHSTAIGQSGSGHTIVGDFKVDESQSDGKKPRTFQVVLYNLVGTVIDRQTVTNNVRYRFFNVASGEFIIVVEFDGAEVARLPLRLTPQQLDVRQDIALEWKADSTKSRSGNNMVVALPAYNRPAENQQLLRKAENAADKKNYAEAVTLLNQIVDRDPKDYEAWIEIGNAYFNLGKLKDAEKACLRAIDENSSFVLPFLNLGKIRMAGKDYQGASEALDEALKLQPTSAEANYLLGEAYLQMKKGSKAVGYLYEALKIEPIKMAEAHLRLALLYNGAGMKDKAVIEYEQFLKKKPDYPERKKLEQYITANKKP